MPVWMVLVEWSSRGILLLLAALSVWSMSIMIQKNRDLPAEDHPDFKRQEVEALEQRLQWDATSGRDTATELMERRYRAYWTERKGQLDRGLAILATLSSTAPFVGLFGTVLGIIQAFGALSQNQNNTASVMTAISEALVATAVGLFVAIPASVAYNLFQRRLKSIQSALEVAKETSIARYLTTPIARNNSVRSSHGVQS